MAKRKSSGEAAMDRLDHAVKVLLKEWAGLSGFSGYKSMGLDEVYEMVNTDGWKTYIDYSNPAQRIVEMQKGDTKRYAKFVIDDDGKVVRDDF